jgi:SGNH hydrolase-like domain, acetyltransferase AlgX
VQQYLYLAKEGLRFRPNLVLLMFYGNDLTDNLLSYYPGFGPRPYATITDDKIRIIESLDASEYKKFILPIPFCMWLNNHSYLYYFLNSRIYQPFFADRLKQMQQSDLREMDSETRFKIFYGVLEKIQTLLSSNKVELLVVLIPTEEEVATGTSPTLKAIDEHCRLKAINCLSLLDKFQRETASGKQLYFAQDIHWTKAGHHAAAQEIADHLRRKRQINHRMISNSG